MTQERQFDFEWVEELADSAGTRSYRPVSGPDEPADPPRGRASASPPDDQAHHPEATAEPAATSGNDD